MDDSLIANATQVLLIPKLVLNCRTQPKQICCNSPEIYFYIMLLVHMTFFNAFNAVLQFATFKLFEISGSLNELCLSRTNVKS